MTRITNFNRKRTYLEAGFSGDPKPDTAVGDSSQAQPKKRKFDNNKRLKDSSGFKKKLPNEVKSELRRRKRNTDKLADTTCFACREKGHAARDCPSNKNKSQQKVGICYRCGSSRHSLSRCKKEVDSDNPLPFASCFVCKAQGHLASTCPENIAKGVYPNGGCCKLCGETSHLAKNCQLRKQDVVNKPAVMGIASQPGADEDDFHVFRRSVTVLDRQEQKASKVQKKAVSTTVPAAKNSSSSFLASSKPSMQKKVVYFK